MNYLDIVNKYDMKPHPEGGYYVETYRADQDVVIDGNISRRASTAIYFLVTPGHVSRLHRIQSDEVWHFYLGGPMTVIELDLSAEKGYKATVLGINILEGEMVQYCVRRGTWFGSLPNEGTAFSLVGCTVSPGFVFEDFELGSRSKLLAEFPRAQEIIERLTEGLP